MKTEKIVRKVIKATNKLGWVDSKKVSGSDIAKAIVRVRAIYKIRKFSLMALQDKKLRDDICRLLQKGLIQSTLVFNNNIEFLNKQKLTKSQDKVIAKSRRINITIGLKASELKD